MFLWPLPGCGEGRGSRPRLCHKNPRGWRDRPLRFRADSVAALVAELAEEARRMGRMVSLDLFSPCLAPLVGQDYRLLKQHCDWAKPMTYRLALGPAGLRLQNSAPRWGGGKGLWGDGGAIVG